MAEVAPRSPGSASSRAGTSPLGSVNAANTAAAKIAKPALHPMSIPIPTSKVHSVYTGNPQVSLRYHRYILTTQGSRLSQTFRSFSLPPLGCPNGPSVSGFPISFLEYSKAFPICDLCLLWFFATCPSACENSLPNFGFCLWICFLCAAFHPQ